MKPISFKHKLAQQMKSQIELSFEEQQEAVHRIEKINSFRIQVIASVAIVFELLLIVFHDLPNLKKTHYILELTLAYLGAHLFLLFISFAVVTIGMLQFSPKYAYLEKKSDWITAAFGMLFLSGVAFITGLDQLTNEQIVSFVTMFTIGSIMYNCKPPWQLIFHMIPTVVFTISVWYFQADPNVASANIINGLLFAVTMMVISIFNYTKVKNDIAKEIRLEAWTEKLEFLAHHDSLTGLYNRRSFEQEVFRLSEQANENYSYALGIMDLDYFKKINDLFGHDAADEVLIRVAEIMKQGIEPNGIVARWGGEEFIFMLYGDSFNALIAVAERLKIAIESEDMVVMNQRILITGSFGLTEVKCHEFDQLKNKFSIVDKALYESKEAGRNRLTVK